MAEVKAVGTGESTAVTENKDSDTTASSTSVYRTTVDDVIQMANETAEKMQAQGDSSIVSTTVPTDTESDIIQVNVGKNHDSFNTTQADLSTSSQYPQRGHEAFIINKKTHSSIAIRQNGQINLASSTYSQYKLNPSGKVVEQSLESVSVTNRRKVNADDVVINEHKLNPYLYQLTDMRKMNTVYNDSILVGNFCLFGSVLVKAWELDLKRYVLIRRPVRLPMFSPLLNVPEIHEGVGVTDPLKIDENILLKSDKGYQVNKVQTDSNSLIGKEGEDGEGIQRKADISISVGNTTIVDGNVVTSNGSAATGGTPGGNTIEEKVWSFLKTEGFTDEGAAGIMGNIQQECHFQLDLREQQSGDSHSTDFDVNDKHGYGLLQWTYPDAKQGLLDKANSMGGKVSDINVQLAYMKDWGTADWTKVDMHGTRHPDNAWESCKKCTDIKESTKLWHDMAERSADTTLSNRYQYAEELYNKHKGKTYSATTDTSNPAVTTPVPTNMDMTNATTFECTAYCPDGGRQEGGFVTATGLSLSDKTQESHLIAVDPRVIPLHSKVQIAFEDAEWQKWNGVYTAVDTGGAIQGNILDVFVGCRNYDLAKQFGRRKAKVKVIGKE